MLHPGTHALACHDGSVYFSHTAAASVSLEEWMMNAEILFYDDDLAIGFCEGSAAAFPP